MKKKLTALVWVALLAVLVLLVVDNSSGPVEAHVGMVEFHTMAEIGHVADVRVSGDGRIHFRNLSGQRFVTFGTIDPELRQQLVKEGARISFGEPESEGSSGGLLLTIIPIALLLIFLIYFFRKSQGATGNVFKMLKSPHRTVASSESRVTFADVGGCEDAKEQLSDIVDFLMSSKRWLDSGARLPRGILLEGPPGCGKTLLARAIAGETKSKFFLISGSEFVELFVGVGAARVRDLFESAVKQAPSVVFIDEIDAVGRRRGSGFGWSHEEREQTLNQLLVCLDGFKPTDQVVVLAATNRPDVLDQALVRPGRIDRRIRVPELSESARLAVLKIHTRKKPLAEGLALEDLARRTAGLTGAQLENLANEAALRAVRCAKSLQNADVRITADDFDRVLTTIQEQESRFNRLDSVLIESASLLAEPTGLARVRLTLHEGPPVEGEVIWADGALIKLRRTNGQSDILIAKRQVRLFEALDGVKSDGTDSEGSRRV